MDASCSLTFANIHFVYLVLVVYVEHPYIDKEMHMNKFGFFNNLENLGYSSIKQRQQENL